MGIKEQVKQGLLSKDEAIKMVRKDSHTYGWLRRRGKDVVINPPLSVKKERKYRSKKVGS